MNQREETKSEDAQPVSTPTRKTQRDITALLAGPITAAIATLAVALIGIFGNQALQESRDAAARLATQEQNYRLYTEMVNQREQAESQLRRDMLGRVLTDFFDETRPDDPAASIRARLLKLELLALNFGESLSLSPLFLEIAETIKTARFANFSNLRRDEFNGRLRSLASRVTDRQVSALSAGGATFEFSVPLAAVTDQNVYVWPDDYVELLRIQNNETHQWAEEEMASLSKLTVGDITRTYRIRLSRADADAETVKVRLVITDLPGHGEPVGEPVVMPFTLDQFNFPMIDSTRLFPDQRFALVMQNFDELSIRLVGICFPGIYAGQRDKPFLNEVIEQLRQFSPDAAIVVDE